jgi:acetolactate synthase-1/2/3 large subunit
VDIPSNILKDMAVFNYPDTVDLPGYRPNYKGNKLQLKRAAEIINDSAKPIIYAGGGSIISGADKEIAELAAKAEIPVTTTLNGIGVFDENNYLSLGMLGMHGTTQANLAITNADCIIALGARFDDRVTGKLEDFAVNADVIHIDIDPAEISKIIETKVPITADVKMALEELIPKIKGVKRPAWINEIEEWKKIDEKADPEKSKKLLPSEIIETLYDLTAGEAIITAGVGQHQMWAAQFHKYKKPRQFITSGGLGTMGYGLPAAIGAQIGHPEEKVVLIAGDGSIQMNIQELGTAQAYNIPIKIIIFNNKYLGMVRQWQEFFYDKRYSSTKIPAPDFVKMGEAYGIWSKSVNKKSELDSALKEAMEHDGPAILDVHIPEEENVYPMVPAGAGLKDMIGG